MIPSRGQMFSLDDNYSAMSTYSMDCPAHRVLKRINAISTDSSRPKCISDLTSLPSYPYNAVRTP